MSMDSTDLAFYKASMVLSGVGDAIGYRNQRWEYCTSGPTIHQELEELGGLAAITATLPDWPISDDTIMHIATAEGLVSGKSSREEIWLEVAKKYKECMNDMEGRKPGPTSMKGCDQLDPSKPDGFRIPFNPTGTGCGAAMRAMCIGLRYPRTEDLDDLISFSIECGRMTHNHPTGYLGSMVSALFTSYAIQRKPVNSWGASLLDALTRAWQYVEKSGLNVTENKNSWDYFTEEWKKYLDCRGIRDAKSDPAFPNNYGVEERDVIYKTFSLDGWAGRSGHDAPMIAYDALLAANNDWNDLCDRALFHAGDSDSTGTIAAAWYGALYGYHDVPDANHSQLEYRERLENLGIELHGLAFSHS